MFLRSDLEPHLPHDGLRARVELEDLRGILFGRPPLHRLGQAAAWEHLQVAQLLLGALKELPRGAHRAGLRRLRRRVAALAASWLHQDGLRAGEAAAGGAQLVAAAARLLLATDLLIASSIAQEEDALQPSVGRLRKGLRELRHRRRAALHVASALEDSLTRDRGAHFPGLWGHLETSAPGRATVAHEAFEGAGLHLQKTALRSMFRFTCAISKSKSQVIRPQNMGQTKVEGSRHLPTSHGSRGVRQVMPAHSSCMR